jgi:hypothetical protein
MMARAKNIFGGRIDNRECPKALGVYNPSDPVCLRPWCCKVYESVRLGCWFSLNFDVLFSALRRHVPVPGTTA